MTTVSILSYALLVMGIGMSIYMLLPYLQEKKQDKKKDTGSEKGTTTGSQTNNKDTESAVHNKIIGLAKTIATDYVYTFDDEDEDVPPAKVSKEQIAEAGLSGDELNEDNVEEESWVATYGTEETITPDDAALIANFAVHKEELTQAELEALDKALQKSGGTEFLNQLDGLMKGLEEEGAYINKQIHDMIKSKNR